MWVAKQVNANKKISLGRNPQEDGFYFPGEWHPHEYTIMQFVPRQNWAGYGLQAARQDWANVANTISEFEPVLLIVAPEDLQVAKKLISQDIELIDFPLNDGWARDSAPQFVINNRGEIRAIDFTFNAWGQKFSPYEDDAQISTRLSQALGIPFYQSALVLEGGAVTLDGEGTLITTEECLLNPNRNPNLSKAEVESTLKAYYNVDQVIWLSKGTTPDPITDGHVDGICVFVRPGTVMLHTTSDRSDPNYQICQAAKQKLLAETDAKGRQLEIIELPLARDVSHINFYIANDCVVVPIANDDSQDKIPMSIIRDAFPERKVVGVRGNTLAQGGGGIHCITQQVPQV